ncbi:sphingosine-1-phosphate lyase [Harmonia axyridis]|uniref:sphingosine-1-phosphate lyase n=1 Tax=Harmonia axyridis TaxID=115357 RepID=UPI001E2785BB|nr:sphingosine-1-phosphate lyase [Harmonia axyridis]
MDFVKVPLNQAKLGINQIFVGKEPWQIVTITTSSVLLLSWLYGFIFDDDSLLERGKRTFFDIIQLIPSVRKEIDGKKKEVWEGFRNEHRERTKNLSYLRSLPDKGLKNEDIMDLLEGNLKMGDYNWKDGLVSGSVYYFDPEWQKLLTKVYEKTFFTNPLHCDVFPGICKIETEVIRMAAELFHGDTETCGTVTTGGTESILMACKTWRDYMRKTKGIKKPEMVVPRTIHSAFDKAAQYFCIRIKYVPVDPKTYKVDLKAMERAITKNTVMLAGSVPNFPYGTMDDIEGISKLGLKYNIPVHVDSCLGGFLTVFMEKAGYSIPLYDFKLPGVSSISADTHKYAFTPKGSSVVLYRNKDFRHFQYTVTTDWPGGVYGSPAVNGSRAGANITTCWATLLHFGTDGYLKATGDILRTAKYIEEKLRKIDGLFIFGEPVTSVVAFGSKVFEIYRLATDMGKLGWNLNALQFPSGVHLAVTHLHTQPGVADKFVNDVENIVRELMKRPEKPVEGGLALYGAAQVVPDRSLVGDFINYYIDAMYYHPCENEEEK